MNRWMCAARSTSGAALLASLFSMLALGSPEAHAQGYYRCQGANGQLELSDRPCAGVQGKLGAMGNTQPQQPLPSYGGVSYRSIDRAPDYLHLMSAECATMNDAMRTGASRGAGWATMEELRYNYHRRCQREEQAARSQFTQQQRLLVEREAVRQQSEQQAQAERMRTAEQCQEMLRILVGKRRRMAELTPGQRDDLLQFDAAYKARCSSG